MSAGFSMVYKGNRKESTRGFTLVELMVVIAVIAILMAIIIPVASRARENARQTSCKANLHAIAVALRTYVNDEGGYPMPYNPYYGTGGITQLYLAGYLSNNKVLRCPNDDTTVSEYNQAHPAADYPGWVNWTQDDFNERYSSYNEILLSDAAYPLYNYAGYRRYRSGAPGGDADTSVAALAGTSATIPELIDLQASHSAEIPTLSINTGQGVYETARWWGAVVYRNPEHPNYGDTESVTHKRVFDRKNFTDTYAKPLYSGDAENDFTASFPGLMNKNVPDSTIITHCPHHREVFGNENAWKDIVVRVGGESEILTKPVKDYDWVVQK